MRPIILYVQLGILLTAFLVSAVTGRTLNPLRGMRPWIVNRRDNPGRYWASMALLVAFSAFVWWMMSANADAGAS